MIVMQCSILRAVLFNLHTQPLSMLYKFYSCNTGEETATLLKNILSGNTLLAADPKTFNDPFECKVVLDLEAPVATRRERYRQDNPGCSESDFTRWIDGLDQSKWHVEQSSRQDIMAMHGIACLTQGWENELLWAHYAKHHTGFCIGYDADVLAQWSEPIGLGDVEYEDDAPSFRFFHESEIEFVRNVAFTKSTCWAYEKEVRILFEGAGLKTLPPGAMREVTVGCRASQELRKVMSDVRVRYPELSLYQASELPTRFRIVRDLIEPNRTRMTSHF